MPTSPRPQPDFLVVGAAKAGTSSLWHWLRRHPEVFMPRDKEPGYFIRGYGLDDWERYLALFNAAGDRRRIGEASAGYLAAPESPRWIRDTLGEIDIIILLRNPVQRAYSLYCWMAMEGYEPLESFAAALAAEPGRIASATFRRTCPQCFDDYLYFHSGLYCDQVKRYLDTFGAARVRVCLFDDLVKNPAAFYAGIGEFLGISIPAENEPPAKNPSFVPRSLALQCRLRAVRTRLWKRCGRPAKPVTLLCDGLMRLNAALGTKRPMPASVREKLAGLYRDDVSRLAELIGRDLSSWLKP